jgi:hypothetical protein
MNSKLRYTGVWAIGTLLLIAIPTGIVHGAPLVVAGSQLVSPPAFFPNSFWGITSSIDRAFAFSVIGGGPYRVEELQIAAFHYDFLPGNTGDFSIHLDESGRPGAEIGTFRFNSIGTTAQILSSSPTSEVVLNSSTPYWILGSTTRGQVNWNLGDNVFGRIAYRSGSAEWTVENGRNVSAFAILGAAVPEPGSIVLLASAIIAAINRRSIRILYLSAR